MKKITVIAILLFTFAECRFPVTEIPGYGRSAPGNKLLTVSLNDRTACRDGKPFGEQPAARGNTTAQVGELILQMEEILIEGYIIPSADAHQNEYPASADERRRYISGFTGSAGTAVVLSNGKRALWTDNRYFLQADDQMDCQWLLMKSGQVGIPTISEWIIESLNSESIVSADARLLNTDDWLRFDRDFRLAGIEFRAEKIKNGNNIVDVIWNEDGRPAYSLDPVFIHDIKYAGVSWQDKVNSIVEKMDKNGADVLVLTTLDETAWLLNLRGSDIKYNPFFRSYVIIDNSGNYISLILFVPEDDVKLQENVRQHLSIDKCELGDPCVSLGVYDSIIDAVSEKAAVTDTIWITSGSSYNIYNSVPEEQIFYEKSPVMLMKAMKNDVEREGMKNAHIRDAVAVIEFLANLETDISNGIPWTELQASAVVEKYRSTMEMFMGSSFETISAFGSNAAIVHYAPTPETNHEITNQSIYLLDSGGQYLDGTTDITRTVHFGTPTNYQMETNTLVLMGAIDYALAIFPKGTRKTYIDILARQHLYRQGLNFGHGVAHGIGAFLSVHESGDTIFENGFHQSDEPGYYEDGQFGIRIENIVAVEEVETKYDYIPKSYRFETITLVPFEPKLIYLPLLTPAQCEWLNAYYERIRNIVGPELLRIRYNIGYKWMMVKTEPVVCGYI